LSVADLQRHLGGIPLERIRIVPPLGTATVEDAVKSESGGRMVCELVDGVLVEKTMGYFEARLALIVGHLLESYLEEHDLGVAAGADGMLRISPDQVRIPDVSFVCWERFPDRKLPEEPAPGIAPDLAIEILSKANTPAEMERKLRDYFAAGVRLVWYIDPPTRSARAYTAVDQSTEISESGTLTGGDVLPGFELPLAELFARAERKGAGG
jgi:Uma2 family endonuclease